MFPIPQRRKGGSPLLGAKGPGQSGPFGTYGDGDPGEDEDHARTVTPDAVVDEAVTARLDAARARSDRRRAQRAEFDRRRRAGLAQRHAAKLRALAERDRQTQPEPPDAA